MEICYCRHSRSGLEMSARFAVDKWTPRFTMLPLQNHCFGHFVAHCHRLCQPALVLSVYSACYVTRQRNVATHPARSLSGAFDAKIRKLHASSRALKTNKPWGNAKGPDNNVVIAVVLLLSEPPVPLAARCISGYPTAEHPYTLPITSFPSQPNSLTRQQLTFVVILSAHRAWGGKST